MFKTVVKKSKSYVSFKVLFLLLHTRAAYPASKYSLGSYHKHSYTALNEYSNNLTASQEAHIFMYDCKLQEASATVTTLTIRSDKAGIYLDHVWVLFP